MYVTTTQSTITYYKRGNYTHKSWIIRYEYITDRCFWKDQWSFLKKSKESTTTSRASAKWNGIHWSYVLHLHWNMYQLVHTVHVVSNSGFISKKWWWKMKVWVKIHTANGETKIKQGLVFSKCTGEMVGLTNLGTVNEDLASITSEAADSWNGQPPASQVNASFHD